MDVHLLWVDAEQIASHFADQLVIGISSGIEQIRFELNGRNDFVFVNAGTWSIDVHFGSRLVRSQIH